MLESGREIIASVAKARIAVQKSRSTVAPAVTMGQSYVLGEMAHAIGLKRCLTDVFGEETGLALLYLAMHQAVRGEPLYLAAVL